MQVWSLVVRVASAPSQWELLKSLQNTRSIAAPFFWAYEPHSMKTRPSRLVLSHCTTASVNVSHPLSLCELAWCARTVSTAFSSRTPAKSRTGSSCCGRSETLACKNIVNVGKFEQILKDYEACIRMRIHTHTKRFWLLTVFISYRGANIRARKYTTEKPDDAN